MNVDNDYNVNHDSKNTHFKGDQGHVEDEIDLKDLFRTLWNNKFFVLSIALLSFVIIIAGGLITRDTEDQVQTMVEFQWDGISNGEFPDSSTFSYSNVFESTVIADSIERSLLDVQTNDVRNSIEVTPIVPHNVSEMMQRALERGEEMTYHAINYKISISYSDLDITEQEAATLLNNLMDAFREDFLRTYTQSDILIDYTTTDYESYDYQDVLTILKRQANRIDTTVSNQLPEGNNFVSTELGYGFNEVISRVELVRDIELDYIDARISSYLLTKDSHLRVTSYSHMIELNERRLNILNDFSTDLQTSITNYTGSEVVIIIPGTDLPEEYASEPYLSTLYERLIDAQEEIAELENMNEYFATRIDRLEGNDPDYVISEDRYDEEIERVEEAIESANTRLKNIVDDTETLLEEYNLFTTRNEIRILMAPDQVTVHSIDTLLLGGIGVVLSGMIGLGALFFKEMFKGN